MHDRVVVTGLGVAAPVGTGVEACWDALINGRSGIGPITRFDASGLRSRIAGEVLDLDAEARVSSKVLKRSARFTQLALVAALEAVADAGLAEGAERENVAVVAGSGIGGFEYLNREHAVFLENGPGRFAPLTVPIIIPNMAAGAIAMETGCRGPNLCLATACASGANSLGTALDLIRNRRCDVAIAGGAESTISAFAIDGYCQLRALSTRNDSPTTASRPFSASRDGFVIAEGAGFLMLERESLARSRGARIYCELAGYGATGDGYHMTAPDPEGRGAVRAMRAALADAGLAPDAIEVINAHGTSTPLNDATETRAIHEVFGAHAPRLAVHSTKSMTGHALGGSCAIEAVVAVLTLTRGVIHPTVNLHELDPQCDLDYVPNVAREARVATVMSNAFGFGGHNAVLVFRALGTPA
ncbi:MAG: beta-ketoacyl-ACP synthase II [Candidatus Eisenbacteria bacterium]|uniref:3-oxoacyl-[acyl-carrier-protein] synthase 2 n=1 Tax=Eiseniibacteriota bacterium TaxID=2212470 RepID=A0A849SZM5_UNCEI|nr:beta-ketoacyl-ACP synthase II [Candidatus Eisenbacteria bacterium]